MAPEIAVTVFRVKNNPLFADKFVQIVRNYVKYFVLKILKYSYKYVQYFYFYQSICCKIKQIEIFHAEINVIF